MFGEVTIYSDPFESRIDTTPFHYGVESSGAGSVFDNGLALSRTEWVRDGVLRHLITPRYWAAKQGLTAPMAYVNNLVVPGSGPSMAEMIAQTERARRESSELPHP